MIVDPARCRWRVALGAAAGWAVARHIERARAARRGPRRRILLPFTGTAISRRALEAALRLARAEDATLMPAFLATVPRHLPLDAAMPRAVQPRHAAAGGDRAGRGPRRVPVDARVGRGRTYRHALEQLLETSTSTA